MRSDGTSSLFKCPKCNKDIDWWLFTTKEELKQYHEDCICPYSYCKNPDKFKRKAIIKRRRLKI